MILTENVTTTTGHQAQHLKIMNTNWCGRGTIYKGGGSQM